MFVQDFNEPVVPSSTSEKESFSKDVDGWGDDDAWEDFDSTPAAPEPHRTASPMKLQPRTPTPEFFDAGTSFTGRATKERQQQPERTPPPPVPSTLFSMQEGGGDDDGWGDWDDTSFGSHGRTVIVQSCHYMCQNVSCYSFNLAPQTKTENPPALPESRKGDWTFTRLFVVEQMVPCLSPKVDEKAFLS